jgi:CarD family transcriptional regulator
MKTFKAGDKVVLPVHGVGVINAVLAKKIGGTDQILYEIMFAGSTSSKVLMPLVQAEAQGLRKVVDKKGIEKVFSILKDRNFKIDTQTWNRRFREYSQKLNTGSVFEIAEVMRDLSVLSVDKELSFGERSMLEKAQNLLVAELAIAKSRTQEKMMGEIQALFC